MIARAIRTGRVARSWTQQELAERVGVATSSIVKWEAGAVEPRLRQAAAIASVFGVTLDQLLAGDAEPGHPSVGFGVEDSTTGSRQIEDAAFRQQHGQIVKTVMQAISVDRRTLDGLDALERLGR